MRPIELAQDDSPEWLAWRHAIRNFNEIAKASLDVFVSIPSTSPLRVVDDVDACIRMLLSSDADIVITVKNAERNPHFNMVVLDEKDNASLAIQSENPVCRRQDAPIVFDMTTVAYVARPEFILNAGSIFDGKVKAVVVPDMRAYDIDTELDFRFAEFILEKLK